ncbi:MAG: xanthine phosphoribosyltransferase [Anaerolineae bacterium]|nr:xanthine phosphoribosyltransferase [Anaerolineae bacterium]MDW8172924.1 xanthine phosphoribosyltransferase [Anaerolineae bacterium]
MTLPALVERIRAEGRNLGGGILKIDSLLNHQIDPLLMAQMGRRLADEFRHLEIDRILTAEISGIAPALVTGIELGVPLVYARKKRPITMSGPIFLETAPSHTKGGVVELMVSSEFLRPDENVLIIDDFLASGETLKALCRMVEAAQAHVVGVGVVVEKTFEGGRQSLREAGYADLPVYALATIISMNDGTIQLAEA